MPNKDNRSYPHYSSGGEFPRNTTVKTAGGMGACTWVLRDGEVVWQFRCPGSAEHKSGPWGDVDADQFAGRVSIQCYEEGCDFHETRNLHDELLLAPDYVYTNDLKGK